MIPMSKEVWQWPEFKAFAKRLGIALDLSTKTITIRFPLNGAVEVEQVYLPRSQKEPGE